MTTERQAAKADAKDVDLAEAERVADLWLALALRKLARDQDAVDAACAAIDNPADDVPPLTMGDVVAAALRGIADHLEGA